MFYPSLGLLLDCCAVAVFTGVYSHWGWSWEDKIMVEIVCVECGESLKVKMIRGYVVGMCVECGTFLEIERVEDGTVLVSA